MNILNADIIVPEWVNWIAVDNDGCVWGYENKPIAYQHGQWDSIEISNDEMLYRTKPPKNWKDELYTWG